MVIKRIITGVLIGLVVALVIWFGEPVFTILNVAGSSRCSF